MPPCLRTRGAVAQVSNTKNRGGTLLSTAIKRKAPGPLRGRPRKMTKAESIDFSGWVEGPGPCDHCKDRGYICRFEPGSDGRGNCHQCMCAKKGCKIRGVPRLRRPRGVLAQSHTRASERRDHRHELTSAARVSDVPRQQPSRSKPRGRPSPSPSSVRFTLPKSAKTRSPVPGSSRLPTQRPQRRQTIRSKGRPLFPEAPADAWSGTRNHVDRLEADIKALRLEYRKNETIIRIKEGRQTDIRAIISAHLREIQKFDGEEATEAKVLPYENDHDLKAEKERRVRTAIRVRQKAYESEEEDDDCVDELDSDDG